MLAAVDPFRFVQRKFPDRRTQPDKANRFGRVDLGDEYRSMKTGKIKIYFFPIVNTGKDDCRELLFTGVLKHVQAHPDDHYRFLRKQILQSFDAPLIRHSAGHDRCGKLLRSPPFEEKSGKDGFKVVDKERIDRPFPCVFPDKKVTDLVDADRAVKTALSVVFKNGKDTDVFGI